MIETDNDNAAAYQAALTDLQNAISRILETTKNAKNEAYQRARENAEKGDAEAQKGKTPRAISTAKKSVKKAWGDAQDAADRRYLRDLNAAISLMDTVKETANHAAAVSSMACHYRY
jgi:hypothetical protein